jgi:hypothetical protein
MKTVVLQTFRDYSRALFTDEDYHCYLHWLEESARACGCAIHAYALMTNHSVELRAALCRRSTSVRRSSS